MDYRDIINQFMKEVESEPVLLEKLRGKPVCVWTRVICDYADLKELTKTPRVKLYRQVYSWLRHRITYEPKPAKDREHPWGKLDPRKKAYWITEARYTRIEVEAVNRALFQKQDE